MERHQHRRRRIKPQMMWNLLSLNSLSFVKQLVLNQIKHRWNNFNQDKLRLMFLNCCNPTNRKSFLWNFKLPTLSFQSYYNQSNKINQISKSVCWRRFLNSTITQIPQIPLVVQHLNACRGFNRKCPQLFKVHYCSLLF